MLKMERISSRKNGYIAYLRQLASDGALRRDSGETVLDGEKLLGEALASGCEVTSLLAAEGSLPGRVPEGARLYAAPPELVAYASPVKNSPGPVFTVRLPERRAPERVESAVVLESVQDPGNVGTVIRTANALGVDAVILAGDCADTTSPRCVRATMGAAFRQSVVEADLPGLARLLGGWDLPLYGAALAEGALDIRSAELSRAAVAIGNEGHGLSPELLGLCTGRVIIPMAPGSESLNAAVAAAIVMWELSGRRL